MQDSLPRSPPPVWIRAGNSQKCKLKAENLTKIGRVLLGLNLKPGVPLEDTYRAMHAAVSAQPNPSGNSKQEIAIAKRIKRLSTKAKEDRPRALRIQCVILTSKRERR